MRVRDAMTTDVLTVHPETPLKDVARALVERAFSGMPVIDAGGRVVGVISEGDFLRKEAAGGTAHRTLWSRLHIGHPEPEPDVATTVAELMSSPALTIGADEPLSSAAAIMSRRQVNRLPVVDGDSLCGIVSRADVVRAFVRSDDDLAVSVQRAIHAVDGLRLVEVRDGVAVLAGTLADAALVDCVRRVVLAVDGIVAVDDREVAWIGREPASEESRWVPTRGDFLSG